MDFLPSNVPAHNSLSAETVAAKATEILSRLSENDLHCRARGREYVEGDKIPVVCTYISIFPGRLSFKKKQTCNKCF